MVRCTADGIVASGTPDRDLRLRALLESAIAACPASTRVSAPAVSGASGSRSVSRAPTFGRAVR
jgi:hypothetical protein